MTIPACQGEAAFDDEAQARYVATGHQHEFGGEWAAVACGGHWHVREVEPA